MSSSIVKFIHNNKIMEIRDVDPNETLLNYIREKLNKTGTKEGCAEGGCGACTIVLGYLKNNKIFYQSVNACIVFLPTIHGKQLILVEDLVGKDGSLHPVQKSMVNFHGSQCGFCTPGFVMSLFSMFKNFSSFDKKIIKNSIAGNLCRCTGYQPIINAAKSLNNKNKVDQFYQTKNETIKLLKIISKKNNSLSINRIDKKYFAPQTINELKILLKKYPKSKILSGGTDLSLIVTKERKNINSIIYINSIKELNYIKKNKKNIEIGATTPLIEFESEIIKHYPDFKDILERYGSVQIRNVATIAGNIATASPIGDTLPLLLALNAKIVIGGSKIDKILYLKDFFINYRKTKLKNGQFIKLIKIPLLQNNIFKAYKISKRIDDDISAVCASFNLNIKNNIIVSVSIAYGGMAAIPKKALYCERSLLNKDLSEKNINIAQKFLEKDFNPIDDMRASSQYRMKIAKNLLFKCFQEIKNNKLIRINV
tara:strand:- start:475 stop:1920 length:1446 start_codon:yes stop_codon:yes gene_type:complete